MARGEGQRRQWARAGHGSTERGMAEGHAFSLECEREGRREGRLGRVGRAGRPRERARERASGMGQAGRVQAKLGQPKNSLNFFVVLLGWLRPRLTPTSRPGGLPIWYLGCHGHPNNKQENVFAPDGEFPGLVPFDTGWPEVVPVRDEQIT